MKKVEITLLVFALFSKLFFFGYNILTGQIYGGASNDNSYITFMMIVDIIPLLLFLKYLMSGKSKKNIMPIILVLGIFVAFYGFGVGVNDINFKCLLAFSIPAALIGILLAKTNSGPYFAKLLEPLMLFLTLIGIISMRYLLSVSALQDVHEEGIGTSSLSYHCGFAFALNLYFLLFGKEHPNRFAYTKTTLYKYFSIALLIVQFVVGLSSGGRGGFVLLLVSAAVMVFMSLIRRNSNPLRTAILLIVMVFIALQYMPKSISDAMDRGSERTFSYISRGRIDVTETSNRDEVYTDCINSIKESPIIGHGLLMKGTPFYGERPHNIFFEILIQGGIIYLSVFLVFMYHLYKKMRRLIRHGHGLYIVPIALYPIVMLMFSASYIGTDLFWFIISYILCCEAKRESVSAQTKVNMNYKIISNK